MYANVVATIQSVLGPIDLELFDAVAPLTVANFLFYTDTAACDASFIVAGFAEQVATDSPSVLNEPGLSNVRGTVVMAKLGGQPDSATTQWFVNVVSNTALDADNGGYTVFADVIAGPAGGGPDQRASARQRSPILPGDLNADARIDAVDVARIRPKRPRQPDRECALGPRGRGRRHARPRRRQRR